MARLLQLDIDNFMKKYKKFFREDSISGIRATLKNANMTHEELMFLKTKMKSPTIGLLISIVGGMLGIDRFFIGDHGKGVLKIFANMFMGIWWVTDWFKIKNLVREKNEQIFNDFIRAQVAGSTINIYSMK